MGDPFYDEKPLKRLAARCAQRHWAKAPVLMRTGSLGCEISRLEIVVQNSALPGVRAKGMTSRIFGTPVRNISSRSNPRPNPACGTVP